MQNKFKSLNLGVWIEVASDQEQTTFMKRAQTEEEPKSAKVQWEKGGSSQKVKPTCATFGKKHYGESLLGT